MKIKELKEGQLGDPIIHTEMLGVMEKSILEVITDEMLDSRFTPGKHSLKTWGRADRLNASDPHYIGVRKQGPLHIDPGYPRYTHQIILRCDEGLLLRGFDDVRFRPERGHFLIIDTHSPHQLWGDGNENDGAYIALSMDSADPLGRDKAVSTLLGYSLSHRFNYTGKSKGSKKAKR